MTRILRRRKKNSCANPPRSGSRRRVIDAAVSGSLVTPTAVRARTVRTGSIVDALICLGVDVATVNDLRNMTQFLVSSLDDTLRQEKVAPESIVALQRCESMFRGIIARSSGLFYADLKASIGDFMMETQAVLRVLSPYAKSGALLCGHDRETADAKLFVLRYLASSINSYFSLDTLD